MIPKQIKIRVDGNGQIGLGHVVRCLSLAHMLKNDFKITFNLRISNDFTGNYIDSEGFEVNILKDEFTFISSLKASDIVVLDGYHFDIEYQHQVKSRAKLFYIDDFGRGEYDVDSILNHAPGISQKDYSTNPETRFLLGPSYALLRPAFLEPSHVRPGIPIKNILICFGGADPQNLTLSTLQALHRKDLSFTIIIGGAYAFQSELIAYIDRLKVDVKILQNIGAPDMKREMESSDLVVVPSSGILFEAIAVGVPIISGYYVDNQKTIYEGFKKKQVFEDAGNFEQEKLLNCMSNLSETKILSILKNQSECIDGLSGERILEHFKSLAS